MPGLLRGVARTAVVAGTATAVSNRVSRRQAGRWSQQEPQPAAPQPAYQAEPAPPPPAPADDMSSRIAQLKELGELKDQGVLSESEFEAQKARVLGS
ncbi:SHOCT domain-containing protein [Embleya sp. NPDC005575]|uniref:SHOCT domain-containing protein n=1 Tax=Embleya sp. NPDC005575 TaxID=3156892 RepID=UPI0033AFD04D